MSMNFKNLVKIGPGRHREIYWWNMPDFSIFFTQVHKWAVWSPGLLDRSFTKFLWDVGQFIALFMPPSTFQYSNLFWNASMPNKNTLANLAENWLPDKHAGWAKWDKVASHCRYANRENNPDVLNGQGYTTTDNLNPRASAGLLCRDVISERGEKVTSRTSI